VNFWKKGATLRNIHVPCSTDRQYAVTLENLQSVPTSYTTFQGRLNMHATDLPEDEIYAHKSRSQKKRESTALQRQSETLSGLSAAQLDEFTLPAELKTAIAHLRTLAKHEARRRQMQYLGRLMRELDAETLDDIAARLAGLNRKTTAAAVRKRRMDP
jgi:ribosome-associated protein